MAGIELVDWSLDYFTFGPPVAPLMLADNSANWGGVFGPPICEWRRFDPAALHATMTVDGDTVATGVGADLMGHPFKVLAWCANHMASQGKSLRKDDLILLGSVTPSYGDFKQGAEIVVTWEELGEVRAIFR
jgi:2-keto-4-pentenoate hydratase